MPSSFLYSSNLLSFSINGHKGELFFFVPLGNGPLVDDEYGCLFLTSGYFNAGNDYYLITLHRRDSTHTSLGWLFPLNLLKEDSDFYEGMDENLLAYLHIGAHKLIERCIFSNQWVPSSGTLDDCKVSDDLFMLVFRRSVLPDSRILELCPYLFMLGFTFEEKSLGSSEERISFNSYRQEKVLEVRISNSHRFHIKLMSPIFVGNTLVNALFVGNLSKLKNPILRYFALYQIIEVLMSVLYRNKYYEYVEKYGNNRRHDLMEQFGELASEKKLIRQIFDIGTNSPIYIDFIDAAKTLLEKIGEAGFKSNPSFEDYLYKIRNLTVHSMPMLTGQMKIMQRVSDIFEYIIVDVMCRTTVVEQDNKLLFVADKSKSGKTNRRLFRQMLKDVGIGI